MESGQIFSAKAPTKLKTVKGRVMRENENCGKTAYRRSSSFLLRFEKAKPSLLMDFFGMTKRLKAC